MFERTVIKQLSGVKLLLLCAVLLFTWMLTSSMKLEEQEDQYLEVDLAISIEGKRPENAWVTVYGIEDKPHEFQADSKGMVFLILDFGKEYRVKVEAEGCLSKSLIFDTTDLKAKHDEYPCDVDLITFNEKETATPFDDVPIAVIRWHRMKRKFIHDLEYTKEMQKKYREMVSAQ